MPSARLRIGLVSAAACAALALSALTVAAPASQASALKVVGFAKIGSFVVRGGTPAGARAAFGAPTRTTDHKDSCTLSWPGLSISFYTLLDRPQCGQGTPFGAATITRDWVTDRGLRKGDTVARAKQLYPTAAKRGVYRGTIPLVVRLSPAIGEYGLTGKVVDGRVTGLYIDDPQGGE